MFPAFPVPFGSVPAGRLLSGHFAVDVTALISLDKPGIGGSVVPVTGRTTKAIGPPCLWWLALIIPGVY